MAIIESGKNKQSGYLTFQFEFLCYRVYQSSEYIYEINITSSWMRKKIGGKKMIHSNWSIEWINLLTIKQLTKPDITIQFFFWGCVEWINDFDAC